MSASCLKCLLIKYKLLTFSIKSFIVNPYSDICEKVFILQRGCKAAFSLFYTRLPALIKANSILVCCLGNALSLSQTSPGFLCVCSKSLLKRLWEKEKKLVASNFSLFTTHLENILPLSSNLKSSSVNSFNLEESKICSLGKGSTSINSNMKPHFCLVQI